MRKRSRKGWSRTHWFTATGLLLAAVGWSAVAESVFAGERQFTVILANSHKQYPSEDMAGKPPGGLVDIGLIDKQYFDKIDDSVGSFAEYWEEISYGDVTISGFTTNWLSLPWSFQPPLINPEAATGEAAVPEDITDLGVHNSPSNFYDLNADGQYAYGQAEEFNNLFAALILDLDGDPNGNDNGPFFVGPGSGHVGPNAGKDVWKPGERFVDMDGDGRWDGLDEANNWMDHDADGIPDNLGPWVDLNGNGVPDNPNGCVYLADDDNDGNPNCCPDGPGEPGCEPFPAEGACPPGLMPGPNGELNDCNGNLIPDACDISCDSEECIDTGWTGACGGSRDDLPFGDVDGACGLLEPDGNDIPDECEFEDTDVDCWIEDDSCGDPDAANPCCSLPACVEIERDPGDRCEYDDSQNSDVMDIVEPFENFMRRWDPCYFDPEVSQPNFEAERTHWIKVFDPASDAGVSCNNPMKGYVYAQSSLNPPSPDPDVPADPPDDPSYIENNYPGDWEALEAEAGSRFVYGKHDPDDLVPDPCLCADGTPCFDATAPDGETILVDVCIAGIHADYNPPDQFTNTTSPGPGGTTVYTAKMQAAPGSGGDASFVTSTPEPGTYIPHLGLGEKAWYSQAYQDRYPTVTSAAGVPPWPPGTNPPGTPQNPQFESTANVLKVVPFTSSNQGNFDPDTDRRFFSANWGGRNGLGGGWTQEFGCGSDFVGSLVFETGPVGITGFETDCNNPILPDETGGAGGPGVYFDGYVEHDDLPSSKYHMQGDQWLGEITSPFRTLVDKNTAADCSAYGTEDCVPSIWGHDIGDHNVATPSPGGGDQVTPACGPYATAVHGNNGRDAGNMLMMELLTHRTEPPFNDGIVWEEWNGTHHPYAGDGTDIDPNENIGFRDYNLDGLIDLGEARHAGSDNYIFDMDIGSPNNGTNSLYPHNRQRMLEDCVHILDDGPIDFDDFVDSVALDRVTCPNGVLFQPFAPPHAPPFPPYGPDELAIANGILSGIVLLPAGAHTGDEFPIAPSFYPIHTEDIDDEEDAFPKDKPHQINWSLWFHDLVISLGVEGESEGGIPFSDFQTAYSAHEYLHSWEGFPDLYDYDVFGPPGPVINCPIGLWDIMASGGLVHPVPILKETPCTEWIEPVDLTRVLTPGVNVTITLPPAEFVRDDSYFFLENENLPGERYYFWSVGEGFDERMPGEGMLVLHTDVGANPDALPNHQGDGTKFTYKIVQADGLFELEAGSDCGDDSDPWPGSSGVTLLDNDTVPAVQWYAQNSWTGLRIFDIEERDASGAMKVTFNWVPTSIPGLRFVQPPGGESVQESALVNIYDVRVEITDVFGGTYARFFYTDDESDLSIAPDGSNYIGTFKKGAPGTNARSIDWNIAGVEDDRYFVFAELVPGPGADGTELSATQTRAGRNNVGSGTLTVDTVAVNRIKATGLFGAVSNLILHDETVNFKAMQVFPGDLLELVSGDSNVRTGCYTVAYLVDEHTIAIEPSNENDTNNPPPLIGDGPAVVTGYQLFWQPLPQNCDPSLPQPGCFAPGSNPPCYELFFIGGGSSLELFYSFHPFFPEVDFTDFVGAAVPPGDEVTIEGYPNRHPAFRTVKSVSADSMTLELETSPLSFGFVPGISAWQVMGAEPGPGDQHNSRSETWRIELVGNSSGQQDWLVNSTLTQPVPLDDDPDQDPYPHMFVDTSTGIGTYTSIDGEVKFTLRQDMTPGAAGFTIGDSWSFTTTGITAASKGVTIEDTQINESPVAIIDAIPLSGIAPLEVTFDGRESFDTNGEPLVFDWDFGDGDTGTGDVVNHTFVESIFHTVTLRVTNPNTGLFGESQVDIDVINNSPTAVISAQPQSGPAPLSVSFSAAQSSDTETAPSDLIYQWNFGDGFAANDDGEPGILINIDHFFNPDGEGVEKFTVMLTVTDVGGQSDVDSIEITVGNTLPVPAIVVTSSTTGPAPHQLVVNAINSFDAEDTPAGIPLIVAWNWGDDTSDTFDQYGMNPSVPDGTVIHEYVAIGQYQISAIVTDSAGDSAEWMGPLITVNDATVDPNAPQASFTISPEGSVEVGEEITVNAGQSSDPNGGEIVSYNWIFGDGSQAAGVVATHAYDAPGNFVILLVVTNDAGLTAGLEKLVVVTGDGDTGPDEPPVPENNKPTALFTASANEVSVGEAITFDAKDSSDPDAGDTLTYVWDFGDGEAGSGVTVSHAYAAAGDYVVKLTVTDTSNASDTNTKSIAVIEAVENLPPVPFIATGPRSTTVGVGLPFDGRLSYDTDGLVVGYEWIFSLDEAVVATNDSGPQITHTFDTAGIYTVVLRVTDNDGGFADSSPEIITVGSQVVPVPPVDTSDGPDGVDPTPGSAAARPQLCGFGLLTSVLGSLLGLSLTMASRRRRTR